MNRIIIIVLLSSVSVFAQNVLVNGDFESGTIKGQFSSGYPDGWDGWGENGWHHSDSGYKRDNYGIAIWDNDTGCIQVVEAYDYGQFELSGEMIYNTTEVLVNKEAVLEIEFWDGPHPTGTKLAETQVGTLTPGHTAGTWYSFSDTVIAPVGTREARVVCETIATDENSTGKAYWDNITLEALITTNSPDYDNSSKVDYLDYAKLAGVWNQVSSQYNLIGSDLIDLEDLIVFSDEWLTVYPGYYLLWSDEFDGPNIDSSNWNHEIGITGNNEWGYNTDSPENSYISDGKLVIVGRKNHLGHDYTTARLNTSWKKNFTYGRMEARIKLPVGGQGIWPAFWMLGQNYEWVGWPMCGELDILEAINDLSLVYGTIHYGTAHHNGGAHYPGVNLSDDYHIYAVEWDTYEIRWYFDNVNYHTDWGTWWTPAADYPAPFNAPFFFILNLAIGGDWPGYPDGSTPFPQTMYIDYVRAYEWRQ